MVSKWVDNDQVFKSNFLPTLEKTERKIAEKAPSALKLLERLGAMDLIDILGLESYVKES